MTINSLVEILLVEDNPTDAELTMTTLKESSLANNLVWVRAKHSCMRWRNSGRTSCFLITNCPLSTADRRSKLYGRHTPMCRW